MLLSDEAPEICASSVSERVVSRSERAANWAAARLLASAVMSIPLPPPSAETREAVAEVEVVLSMA